MESSLTSMKKMYDRAAGYVKYVNDGGWMAGREDVSKFWSEIFQERKNYPDFNDMVMMRRGATYPLADEDATTSEPQAEFRRAQAAWGVVSKSVPGSYFEDLEESVLGCPTSFDFNGRMLSAGAIINALTAYRIIEWCNATGLTNRPLQVLEIGAGYGQVAYQLLRRLEIKSYTTCDLPENLFLCSFYLQANFPDRCAVFVGEDSVVDGPPQGLVFLAPPFLKKVWGPFNLVINSYSFQEMNRSSVQEYFEFVGRTLAPDGLFYSLNAHRKAGVLWPSDYPVEKFHLRSFLPVRKCPFQVFATNPYEVVMTARRELPPSGEVLARFKRHLDALGAVLQLGLHDEIVDVCQRFSQNRLDEEERDWLECLYTFLRERTYARKREVADRMRLTGTLQNVVAYLAGSLEFASGRMKSAQLLLEEAVDRLARSHAKARTYMMLSSLAHRIGARTMSGRLCEHAQNIVPHLAEEISSLVKDYRTLAAHVAYQLYLDLPRPAPLSFRGMLGLARRTPASFLSEVLRCWHSAGAVQQS